MQEKKLKKTFLGEIFFPPKTKKYLIGIFERVEKNGSMRKATHFYIGADNSRLRKIIKKKSKELYLYLLTCI